MLVSGMIIGTCFTLFVAAGRDLNMTEAGRSWRPAPHVR
jgi:hypothetical protein